MKQQRRVFLKVIAVCPLVACAGAGPESSFGEGGAGNGGSGHASSGAGGKPSSSGSGGTAGNSVASSGSGFGGSPLAGSGNAGALASGGVSAGAAGSGSAGANNPGMSVGNVSAFPVGSFSIAGGIFFIGRDATGLYAMSMQCTHKFCAVDIVGAQLDCPCHHSRFDRSGNVLAGPATTHFRTTRSTSTAQATSR